MGGRGGGAGGRGQISISSLSYAFEGPSLNLQMVGDLDPNQVLHGHMAAGRSQHFLGYFSLRESESEGNSRSQRN